MSGCHDPPDEGDVSHGQETDQHRAAHDARVPGILPVHQGVDLVWAGPHADEAGDGSLYSSGHCVW